MGEKSVQVAKSSFLSQPKKLDCFKSLFQLRKLYDSMIFPHNKVRGGCWELCVVAWQGVTMEYLPSGFPLPSISPADP